MKQLDRMGTLGSPKLLYSTATGREKEPTAVSSISKKNSLLILFCRNISHCPYSGKAWLVFCASLNPVQNLCFGDCWEEQVCSRFPSSLLSCFNLSRGFSVIQPSPVVASASSLFSSIFTGIQSHSNLFRHIVGSFPEDYICGRLEILFTTSYFCVAVSVCKELHENILYAQTQPSKKSK